MTPFWGFSTVIRKLEMAVVPAGNSEAMLIDVVFAAVPEQIVSFDPTAQVLAAPGNNGALDPAIAVVT